MPLIPGLLLTLLAHVGLLLAAHGLMRATRPGRPVCDLLWVMVLKWMLGSAVVLVLGTLGLLKCWWLFGICVSLGMIAIVAGGLPVLRADLAQVGRLVADARAWWRRASAGTRAAATAAGAFAGSIAIRAVLHTWFIAPFSWDEMSYHLPKLALWVQTGSLGRPDIWDTRTCFPSGFQTLQALWVVILHHDVIIEMAGVEFLAAGVLAVSALGRMAGLERIHCVLGAVLFVGMPIMQTQSTSGINDSGIAILALIAFAFAFRPAPVASTLGYLFVILLLGVSIKPTMLHAAVGLSVPLVLAWRRRPAVLAPREGPPLLRLPVLFLAAFVGLYWYGRNSLEFGNPVYPAGISIFGWQPFLEKPGIFYFPGGDLKQSAGLSLSDLKMNLRDFLDSRLYDPYAAYNSLCLRMAGWGWYGLPFAVPCFLLALARRRLPAIMAMAFGLSLVWTFAAVTNDFWNMRFISWFAALPCLAVGPMLVECAPVSRRVAGYALALTMLLTQIGSTFALGIDPTTLKTAFGKGWHDRNGIDYLGSHLSTMKGSEPVVFNGCGIPFYPLYLPGYSRRVVAFRNLRPEEILELMRREGAIYAMIGNGTQDQRLPDFDARNIDAAVERGILVPLGNKWYRRGDVDAPKEHVRE